MNALATASAVCLVVVWLAYPLTMMSLARLRPARVNRQRLDGAPYVSVVIATREPASAVQARVEDVLRTTYPAERLEVIVALDGAAEEGVVDALRAVGSRVRVVRAASRGGKAAALNAGAAAAQGELLVFTDTYQRFAPDAIQRLVEPLADPRVGAVSGRLELGPNGARRSLVEWYWALEWRLRRAEAQVHSTVGVSGSIYALRRSLWVDLPDGLILDDLYLPMHVVLGGHRVAFVGEARALETRRPSWRQEYRRKVRTLTGNLQFCAWLPRALVPVRNPIWLQLVFHKLLRLLTPYWLLIVGAWAAVHLLRSLSPYLLETALLLLLVSGVTALAAPQVLRAVRSALLQGALLQAAIVVATVNGLRGRWNVWRP